MKHVRVENWNSGRNNVRKYVRLDALKAQRPELLSRKEENLSNCATFGWTHMNIEDQPADLRAAGYDLLHAIGAALLSAGAVSADVSCRGLNTRLSDDDAGSNLYSLGFRVGQNGHVGVTAYNDETAEHDSLGSFLRWAGVRGEPREELEEQEFKFLTAFRPD